MLSVWGIDHGYVSKAYQFKESNHKRDASGRFSRMSTGQKAGTVAGAVGAVGGGALAARYGAKMVPAMRAARASSDKLKAQSRAWSTHTNVNDLPPLKHPTQRAANEWAESHAGHYRVRRDASRSDSRKPTIRAFRPSYQETVALKRLVRESDLNEKTLFRGFTISGEAFDNVFSKLKPGDRLPAHKNGNERQLTSWTTSQKTADRFGQFHRAPDGRIDEIPQGSGYSVTMMMDPGSAPALNISGHSLKQESEWLVSDALEVTGSRMLDGVLHIKVKRAS